MTGRSTLNAAERSFVAHPPRSLARIATVDQAGMPHVVPGGWSYDEASHELVLGGRDVPATRRAEHVRRSGVAAIVIDGLAPGRGWAPWAFVVRGRARIDDEEGTIKVACDRVTSWGLEGVVGDG